MYYYGNSRLPTTVGRQQIGFTLIELMVVVAILAIIASVALPSYRQHVLKSRRAAGAACLLQAQQQMERFYTTTLAYNAAGSPTVFTCDSEISRFYTVSVSGVSAKAYTLTAAPQGAQTADSCGSLTVNQTGAKTPTGSTCW